MMPKDFLLVEKQVVLIYLHALYKDEGLLPAGPAPGPNSDL